MYLSRLILEQRSPEVRRDLADCHNLHSRIMTAFPHDGALAGHAREHFGVLYRLETAPRSNAVQLLVQSRERPDWSRLAGDYLLDTLDDPANPDMKDVGEAYDRIRNGMELRFRLRANPTRRVSATSHPGDPLARKRVELQTEEEWLAWLARKGESHGFELLAVRAQPATSFPDPFSDARATHERLPIPDVRSAGGPKVTGRKRREGNRALTFGAVIFDGRLLVTDADAMRAALASGIGSAKAYGFGLLSVAAG